MTEALHRVLTGVMARMATEEDRGASLVEYALLIALIAVICVVAVTVLGETASTSFSSTASGFAAN